MDTTIAQVLADVALMEENMEKEGEIGFWKTVAQNQDIHEVAICDEISMENIPIMKLESHTKPDKSEALPLIAKETRAERLYGGQ